MLKGNNSLRLNPLTMMQIIQEWVDREFKQPVKVSGISWLGNGENVFAVSTVDKPEGDKAK